MLKKGQSEAKILNEKFGSCIIIDLNYILEDKKRSYNTRCLVCNKESWRRWDHFKKGPKYCKFCKDKMSAKSSPNSVINSLFSGLKSNAKSRDIQVEITKEYFTNKIKENCYYCGDSPIVSQFSKTRNRSKILVSHNGIDRVDSSKGYTIDNIVTCCSICNIMKNKFNEDVFFDKITKIYNNHLK